MNPFSAVMIGGPPHSGKSVLTYGLTRALRTQGVDHYVLRACPDGEGDWSQETRQEKVRLLRVKGRFTPEFVQAMSRDIERRHLPLLVDVGGKPTPEQEVLFEQCTHAILISRDPALLDEWRERAERCGLLVLAELHSELQGQEEILDPGPPLRGRITGLERGRTPSGPVFQALVDRVAELFRPEGQGLRERHLAQAPAEMSVDLEQLIRSWKQTPEARWALVDLPRLLEYLPAGVPLALYGRAPVWVYTAAALLAYPAEFHLFDIRLGWTQPVPLQVQRDQTPLSGERGPVNWSVWKGSDFSLVEGHIPEDTYVDYEEMVGQSIPAVISDRGVVLSGKLPYWLFTAMVRAYAGAPWIAVRYIPKEAEAVVIHSTDANRPVGSSISVPITNERNAGSE